MQYDLQFNLFQVSTRIIKSPWNMIFESITYMESLLLCIGCLTLSIPPIYIGNKITDKYIRWSTYLSTAITDVPFIILRCFVLLHSDNLVHYPDHSDNLGHHMMNHSDNLGHYLDHRDNLGHHYFNLDAMFYAMMFKEIIAIAGCLCILSKNISHYLGSTYLSLDFNDPDCEEYEMDGVEDYV